MNNNLYIGLMSGTSVDSVDTVLVELYGDNIKTIGSCSYPISKEIKQAIFLAVNASALHDKEIKQLDKTMATVFVGAVTKILNQEKIKPRNIIAIGSHGQTIKHSPRSAKPFSLQVGNPKIIADTTKITTVADFRSQDIAAGGQGAPLTPVFHEKVFSKDQKKKIIVNIGGITNITSIEPCALTYGYDTGPGNCLMDCWSRRHNGNEYDKNGDWAASGTPDKDLLEIMLSDNYFQINYPKSTGPDYFNINWINMANRKYEKLFQPRDVQATLLQLTVKTLTKELLKLKLKDDEKIFCCGGGLHNTFLMNQIERELNKKVFSTNDLGINPDYLEAISFAWFAKQRMENFRFELSRVTGSKGEIFLGKITRPSR